MGVRLLGRVPHDEIPALLADGDVLCSQPARPLGQALLEGRGMRLARSSLTGLAAHPFVPRRPASVDPLDVEAMTMAMRATVAFRVPK